MIQIEIRVMEALKKKRKRKSEDYRGSGNEGLPERNQLLDSIINLSSEADKYKNIFNFKFKRRKR